MANISTLNQRPIFIVGAARSGTTLMRFMISQHPRIYIPPQSGFIPLLFRNAPTSPMSRRRTIHSFQHIFKSRPFIKHWRLEHPCPDDFLNCLPDFSPASLLNAVYSQYAQQYGADRWGDKTPIYTGHIDLINKIFPQAQFIHIIRDGRDVALSLIKTYKSKIWVDIYFSTVNWKHYVSLALTSARQLGADQYLEVRYEQLTADPEGQLKRICDYLGEEYVPAMSRPHELAREVVSATNIHARTRQPVTTQRTGKWKREMASADLRLFQAVAGDLLEALAYSVDEQDDLSPLEKTRLYALMTKFVFFNSGRRCLESFGIVGPR